MAYSSKCPSCSSTSFETVVESPDEAKFKMLFTRCSACGVVVGVTEYYNIGATLELLAKKLNITLFD